MGREGRDCEGRREGLWGEKVGIEGGSVKEWRNLRCMDIDMSFTVFEGNYFLSLLKTTMSDQRYRTQRLLFRIVYSNKL